MAVSVGEIEATFRLRDEMSAQLRAAAGQIETAERAIGSVGKTVNDAGNKFDAFGDDVAGANKQLKALDLNSVQTSMRNLGSTLSSVGRSLTIGVTAPILAVGAASIKMAMDAVESENLFEVSFGNMAEAARTWSKETSDALGLNEFELRRTSATIFTMVESMGLGREAAFDMATGVTQLSADMASFFNLSNEEAFDKLRAGLTGETEPLKRLGILVDEATIKTAAYQHGIAQLGDELTQQQKVQARYASILDQTSKAQGDLARTLDSPTNQLRIMKERGAELVVTLGMSLLPVFKDVLDVVARIAPVVERAVKWFTELPGPVRAGAVAIALIAAATGPLLIAFGSLLSAGAGLVPLFASTLPTAAGTSAMSLTALTAAVGRLKAAFIGFAFSPLTLGLAAAGTAAVILKHELDEGTAALQRKIQATKDHDTIQRAFNSSATMTAEQQAEVKAALERTSNQITKTAVDTTYLNERFSLLGMSAGEVRQAFGSDLTSRLDEARKTMAKLTDEQRRQISAGKELGLTVKEIADQTGIAETVVGMFADTLKSVNQNTVGEALKKLKDGQAELILQAQAWVKFAGSDVASLPKQVQEDYYDALQSVVDQFGSLKSAGLESYDAIYQALDRNVGRLHDMRTEFNSLVTAFDVSKIGGKIELPHVTAPAPLTLDLRRSTIYGKYFKIPTTSDFSFDKMPGAPVTLGPAPPASFSQNVFGTSSAQFGQQLGSTITQAFAGGGNPVEAASSLMGQNIGNNLVKRFGKSITANLGDTLGGAFSALIPGVGALLGPLVGAIGGKIKDLLSGGEGAKANDLRDEMKLKFGDAAGAGLAEFVRTLGNAPGLQDAYKRFMSAGNRKDVEKAFTDIEDAADKASKAMGKYGLSLDDLKSPQQKFTSDLHTILTDFNTLAGIGFSTDAITKGAKDGLNNIVRAALDTSEKLPKALAPFLETLVRSGGLADDVSAKLLGLKNSSLPNWQEMQAAAERYGIAVEDLGPLFQQSRLNSDIEGLVADWKLLNIEGANYVEILKRMAPEAQKFLDTALRWGIEIPESARPLLEMMVEQGLLTDQAGVKLENLDNVKFGESLTTKVEELVTAIRDLISELRDDLPGELNNIANNIPTFTIPVVYDYRGGGSGAPIQFENDEDRRRAEEYADYMGTSLEEAARNLGIPTFAKGGYVDKPTLALIGERGPEYVVPASKMDWGGGSISLSIDARGAYFRSDEDLRTLAKEITHFLPYGVRKWGYA